MGVVSTGRHAGAPRTTTLVATPHLLLNVLRLIAAAVAVVVLLAVFVGGFVLHLGVTPVLTGSMRPAYAPGDAVVTRPVPVSQLRPGMIAVFVPPGETSPFAHRIVSISGSPDHPTLVTKGDANPVADSWRATLPGPTVARVVAVAPKVGYPLTWLHDRRLRAALIGALGLLVTTIVTRSVLRSRPRPVAAGPSPVSTQS